MGKKKASSDKLQFIVDIVKELGDVGLSSACGEYFDLTYNGEDVIAISFAGKYGYNQTPVEKLNPELISTIYDDLYRDYGD